MVTADSVKAKIQNLIAQANAATGGADADMTAAVAALIAGYGQGGGGNAGIELPEPQLLCTLVAEMSKKEWLTANPIPLKYKHSILFIKITGSNIATTGSYTVRWNVHFIGQYSDSGNDGDIRNQTSGLVAPDSISFYSMIYSLNPSYAKVVENQLTADIMTNSATYYAAGNNIYYLEIPFNFQTMTIDMEER